MNTEETYRAATRLATARVRVQEWRAIEALADEFGLDVRAAWTRFCRIVPEQTVRDAVEEAVELVLPEAEVSGDAA